MFCCDKALERKTPLRVRAEAAEHLASLPQFQGIPDAVLIRLATRRTRLQIESRWVAISLILSNRIPIPVAEPDQRLK